MRGESRVTEQSATEVGRGRRQAKAEGKIKQVETSLYSCQEPDEGGIDARARLALGVQPTRAVVEQWRKPHEPGGSEVFL
jgi:hypothetical protein